VSAGSLARTFPQMLDLLVDVVRRPSFPEAEMERQRASRLAQLLQQRENAGMVANTVLSAALFGRAHAYGYTDIGTEASNRAMTVADVRGFWQRNVVPNNAALVVSGRITEAELRPLVQKAFGDWASGKPDVPPQRTPQSTAARVIIVDRPGAPQTQIRVGSIGAPRATPDYEAIRLMNETLGGLFTSRININLREEHGYTYGGNSGFVFRREAGPFMVSTGVRTDVTAPAIGEILKELGRMREGGVTADELTLARDSTIRSLPAEFETSNRVTSSTVNLFAYDLEPDYYTSVARRYAAVTAPQVGAAAKKYIDPANVVIVAVGDRARIQPEIEKLNIGPIEVWGADGAPLPQR
jgi:zinc protease